MKEWNLLPAKVVNAPSINKFKRRENEHYKDMDD